MGPDPSALTPETLLLVDQSVIGAVSDHANIAVLGRDASTPWRQAVLPRLARQPVGTIGGLATSESLFVIERLAWDKGLGLGLRIEMAAQGQYKALVPETEAAALTAALLDLPVLLTRLAGGIAAPARKFSPCHGQSCPLPRDLIAFTLVPRRQALAPYAMV
jgi:hypothetical protein